MNEIERKNAEARRETMQIINDIARNLKPGDTISPYTYDWLYHRLFTIIWRLL